MSGCEESPEQRAIDGGQRFEIGDRDALVLLMDRRVHRTDLDNLGTDVRNVAPVRGAPAAGEHRLDSGDLADGRGRVGDQATTPRQKRCAVGGPREIVIEMVPVDDFAEARRKRVAAARGREAEVNITASVPGMTLVAPVPACRFEIRKLVGGKSSVPSSQRVAASSAIAGEARWIGLRASCGYAT